MLTRTSSLSHRAGAQASRTLQEGEKRSLSAWAISLITWVDRVDSALFAAGFLGTGVRVQHIKGLAHRAGVRCNCVRHALRTLLHMQLCPGLCKTVRRRCTYVNPACVHWTYMYMYVDAHAAWIRVQFTCIMIAASCNGFTALFFSVVNLST